MTCKELQRLLYSTRIEDFDPVDRNFLKKHLADCETCKTIFREVSKADRILDRIKEATPRIRNEQAMTESIIAAIVSEKKWVADADTNTFLDRLSDIFSMEIIRFACSIILLLCGMTYVFMEYNDTKAIVSLEQRLGKKSEMNRAYIFQQEINVLNFLSDLYNLSNGSTSSVELTNTLVLMKKTDLNALLKGYRTLDKASQTRLNEMWDKYRKEESSIIVTEKNRVEITALRNEIERLKKELQQSNLKKGRQ
ncbi:MAG: hypothetical protein NTX44_13240 [Ignavibacteriales bacterium]|nr:hypothetical protein [Ignavibacteriales bacterium]